MYGAGLKNAAGEYNCFLNVIIQVNVKTCDFVKLMQVCFVFSHNVPPYAVIMAFEAVSTRIP